MREIIFKGFHECKDGDTTIIVDGKEKRGKWVYGAFVPDALEQTHGEMVTWGFIRRYQPNRTVESVEMIEVHRYTIGQYTGIHDKNGKRIFEGDIVKVHDAYKQYSEPSHEFTGVVEFDNASFLINQDDCVKHYRWMDYECEVVSTIHDEVKP